MLCYRDHRRIGAVRIIGQAGGLDSVPNSPSGRETPHGSPAVIEPIFAAWNAGESGRHDEPGRKSRSLPHLMLQNIKQLYGKKLGASDGDIGHVQDFYFDDQTWAVRYLVADTGSWLSGRQVLLTPHAFGLEALGRSDGNAQVLRVHLTRKQIEDSPPIELHRPVSRQYELAYYRYYGWPSYWEGGGMWGTAGFPVVIPPSTPENQPHHGHQQRDDPHLRSTKAVTGYHIQAPDGAIGDVSSFMVDGRSWAIRELEVETGHWYAGKKILLLPKNIDRISYEDSTVFVNLTKGDIQQTTRNDVAQATAKPA